MKLKKLIILTALISILNTSTTFALFSESANYKTEINPINSTSTATSGSFRLTSQIKDIQTISEGTTLQIDHIEMPPNEIGFCGDGNIDPGEQCDTNNFGGETCNTNGFDNGNLVCNACTISTANCSNNQIGGSGGGSTIISPENLNIIEDDLKFKPEIIPNLELKVEKTNIKTQIKEPVKEKHTDIKTNTKKHESAKEITETETCEIPNEYHEAPLETPTCNCPTQTNNCCWICIIAITLGIINLILMLYILVTKKDKRKLKKRKRKK